MGSRRPLLVILSALAVLGGLGWLVTGGSDTTPQEPTTSSPAPAGPGTRSADRTQGLIHEQAEEGELRSEVVEVAVKEEVTAGDPETVLRGRVVSDVLGSPLPGATVEISRLTNSEFYISDASVRDARQPVVTTSTDDDGRFVVTVPRAVPLGVVASAPEHATTRRDHLFAGDEVELRLAAAAILEGVLSRAPDGAPVAGALLVGRDSRRVEQCRAYTDLGGRFLFEDLQPGLLTVDITPRDAAAPPSRRVELEAGQRTRLDLLLERGVRVFGVVSDPEGRPIEGAEVGVGSSFQRSVRTDAQGWYELLGMGGTPRRDLGALHVRAEGHGGERRPLAEGEPAEDMRIDFELQRGRIATGRVVDGDGDPLEGVHVAGVGSKSVEGVSRSDWVSTVTASDGRFELNSLHVLIDHQLFLRKDGYGTRVYDFPADEGKAERIDHGDLVLLPAGRIEGVVVSTTGVPIPDHLVKLRGANRDLGRFRPDAEPIEKTWVTSVRQSRTDTRGRFHFSDLPGGELRVTATVAGKPEARAEAAVDLQEGEQIGGIELMLDLGEPITGIVRAPDGSPASGVFVQVAGGEDMPRIRATSGAGGRFELLGVTRDMGVVELFTIVASYNWHNPDSQLGASQRIPASAGDTDVVLELRELVSLSGRTLDGEGRPLTGVQILAYPGGAARVPGAVLKKVTSDGEGSFLMELPEGCRVDLVAAPPEGDADDGSSNPSGEPQASEKTPPEPLVLELVESSAKDVLLRFPN